MISPAEYKNGTTQTTKQPNPVFSKQDQAQGDTIARPSTAAPSNCRMSPTQPDHRAASAPTCSSWPAPSIPHNAAAAQPDSPAHRHRKARLPRPVRYGKSQGTPTPPTCPAGNPPSLQTPYSQTRWCHPAQWRAKEPASAPTPPQQATV